MNSEKNVEPRPENPWQRLLYIILFALIFNITELIIFIVVLIQWITMLTTGKVHERLQLLGRNLGAYVQQIIEFMTYGTDRIPYPFSAWPRVPKGHQWPF